MRSRRASDAASSAGGRLHSAQVHSKPQFACRMRRRSPDVRPKFESMGSNRFSVSQSL